MFGNLKKCIAALRSRKTLYSIFLVYIFIVLPYSLMFTEIGRSILSRYSFASYNGHQDELSKDSRPSSLGDVTNKSKLSESSTGQAGEQYGTIPITTKQSPILSAVLSAQSSTVVPKPDEIAVTKPAPRPNPTLYIPTTTESPPSSSISIVDNYADPILDLLRYVPPKTNKTFIIHASDGIGSWGADGTTKDFAACNAKNCVMRNDMAEQSDIVLTRGYVPDNYLKSTYHRPPNQLFLYYQLESSAYHGVSPYPNVMNWTATFRLDSDILAPYGWYVPIEAVPKDQQSGRPPKRKENYAEGKTSQVAWFVSNCGAQNNRLGYANELNKHINVDIYGACGSKSCPRWTGCEADILKKARFYLSFENSNCKDYATEKYFATGLGHDVLPIVMGASKEEYVSFSPPNSFIHVDDFESPKHLADHLKYLSKNDTAYNDYFQWKGVAFSPPL